MFLAIVGIAFYGSGLIIYKRRLNILKYGECKTANIASIKQLSYRYNGHYFSRIYLCVPNGATNSTVVDNNIVEYFYNIMDSEKNVVDIIVCDSNPTVLMPLQIILAAKYIS